MDADAHRIPIPRRRNPLAQKGETSRGVIIVAAVMHKIRVSSAYRSLGIVADVSS